MAPYKECAILVSATINELRAVGNG